MLPLYSQSFWRKASKPWRCGVEQHEAELTKLWLLSSTWLRSGSNPLPCWVLSRRMRGAPNPGCEWKWACRAAKALAAVLELSHPCWQPWVGSVHCPRGWVLLLMASSRAHRQHSPAELHRPQSCLPLTCTHSLEQLRTNNPGGSQPTKTSVPEEVI